MKTLLAIFLGTPLAILLVYIIVRVSTSAYFRSKREHLSEFKAKLIKELRDE